MNEVNHKHINFLPFLMNDLKSLCYILCYGFRGYGPHALITIKIGAVS